MGSGESGIVNSKWFMNAVQGRTAIRWGISAWVPSAKVLQMGGSDARKRERSRIDGWKVLR